MSELYLVLRTDSQEAAVWIAPDKVAHAELLNDVGSFRTSPLFAVAKQTSPTLAKNFFISFFTFDGAYQRIADIADALPREDRQQLWTSIGLASLVVISDDVSLEERIRSDHSDRLLAVERWTVKSNTLKKQEAFYFRPEPAEPTAIELQSIEGVLDDECVYLAREIHLGLTELYYSAHRLCPKLAAAVDQMAKSVNEILSELSSLVTLTSQGSVEEREANQKRINGLTDYLIQINSVLAYSQSQTFGGSTPILRNRAFIPSHTLLGVGTATLALHAFCQVVDRATAENPVYETIRSLFDTPPAVDVFRDLLNDFQPDQWDRPDANVDFHLANVESKTQRPHLLFFSARLGFQESPYSVSAAVQALPFADTVKWNLMTLSHELMHSHVRELLPAIFSTRPAKSPDPTATGSHPDMAAPSPPTELPDDVIEGFLKEFRSFHDGKPLQDFRLKQSLRFVILNYCIFRRGYDPQAERIARGTTETKLKIEARIPPKNELWSYFRSYYRDINEIMVHVFDYHYFYNGAVTIYLPVLWESWLTVPSVLVNIDHYVVRSLATVSTTLHGSLSDRFDLAIDQLKQKIKKLQETAGDSVLVQRLLERLDGEESKTELFLKFLPAAYLAEATYKFLLASGIQAVLYKDKNVKSQDGASVYPLKAGEFEAIEIGSPIPLIADRLRRHVEDGDVGTLSVQHRSAWLYLACAATLK
ncbi:MAG: hypothetical protein HQ518_27455 [Rhodopirellula sp.]|nr:hypothetical protein [Rhodopirellula sp.]